MMKKITTNLNPIAEDRALRSGDFFLIPERPYPPVFASNLEKNVRQRTWIDGYDSNGEPIFSEVQSINNIFTVVAGTALEMFVIAQDPSLIDPDLIGDDSKIQYTWKKDGAAIVSVNALENGKGIPGVAFSAKEIDDNASGVYTCEISNAYGTTESTPITLQVIDPKTHPLLFKNLIKNGSSITNWTVGNGVITRAFLDFPAINNNFGSLPGSAFYDFKAKRINPRTPADFRFSQSGHGSLLYNILTTWLKKDRNLYDPNSPSDIKRDLPDYLVWYAGGFPACIVPNEDVDRGGPAAFFPGLNWMDRYNINTSDKVIGLASEAKNQVLTYITRDRLKFKKDGGEESVNASQTVNLDEVSTLIDGGVLGVKGLDAQFFAYVGAGLTGYKIKATTETGESVFNWYVIDSDDFYDRIRTNGANSNPKDARVKVVKDSVIEIIPLAQDTTQISLVMRNAGGQEIETVTFDGPDASDVFAIKEKAYLPLTWYPIFDLLITNNNVIKIFGQKYSDTNALVELMSPNPEIPTSLLEGYNFELQFIDFQGDVTTKRRLKNIFNKYRIDDFVAEGIITGRESWNIEDYLKYKEQNGFLPDDYVPEVSPDVPLYDIQKRRLQYIHMKFLLESVDRRVRVRLKETPIYGRKRQDNETVKIFDLQPFNMDRNATFFLKKFPFKEFDTFYPRAVSQYSTLSQLDDKRLYKALEERGAAALFAVGGTVSIPKNTRSIDVVINFTHDSDAIDDTQPEARAWTVSQIYRNDFSFKRSNARPMLEYGYPRCGVTLTKLQVFPRGTTASRDFASYFIPPPQYTVLGMEKRRLYENVHDTSRPGLFQYQISMPKTLPSIAAMSPATLNNIAGDYESGVKQLARRLGDPPTAKEQEDFRDSVVAQEDSTPTRPENIQDSEQSDVDLNNVTLPQEDDTQGDEQTQQ